MPAPNEITPNQLARLIGTPDAPLIVDLRIDEDYAEEPRMIPGSFRHCFRDIDGIAAKAGESHVALSCHKGRKISQGVMAMLRHRGIEAQVIEGGHLAWIAAGLPVVSCDVARDAAARTVWVTRHRPKIDRIACPWLIRRFVDPNAVFLFVPPRDVAEVADRFGAEPFDVEGVRFSHRGEMCSFDTMLDEFGLAYSALDEMARVIRGADTDRHDLSPQAAGLLALSVGLSRMFRDDSRQLGAGMALYDALFRWARDGMDEGHDWPSGRTE